MAQSYNCNPYRGMTPPCSPGFVSSTLLIAIVEKLSKETAGVARRRASFWHIRGSRGRGEQKHRDFQGALSAMEAWGWGGLTVVLTSRKVCVGLNK